METHKPSQLEFLTQSTSKKTRREDHVRLRALNGLLHKALSDLLCTPQVSQEVCDLHVELTKVEPRGTPGARGPGKAPQSLQGLRAVEGLVSLPVSVPECPGGCDRQHGVRPGGLGDPGVTLPVTV